MTCIKYSGILMRGTLLPILFIALASLTNSCNQNNPALQPEEADSWQKVLEEDLHMLGHRNWILVVDKAFPEQSSPGMKYIYVDEELIPTLQYVLNAIESSTHVSPVIYSDKELSFITEDQVPGIDKFKSERGGILAGREVNTLLHEDVFSLLDESSSLFRTLVIKTNCTKPYTSVFLQMDCSYWGQDNEAVLRNKMSESSNLSE